MLLELDNITLRYGHIQALHGISLTVGQGEVVALIGANGAGKSTTMRAISGLRPIAQGSIKFDGQDISKLRADLRVVRGVSQSPEGRGIFPGMTVRENLEMGAYTRRVRAEIDEDLERSFTLFPRLKEREKQAGGTMPEIVLNRVDLPAPLGPTTVTNWPSATDKVTSLKARRPP